MFSSSSPHFFDSGGLFLTELKSCAVVLRDLGFWNSKAETNFSLFDVDLYYLETLSMQNPNCGLSWLKCQRATGNSKKSNHKPTLVDISKLFSFTTVCTCSLDCKTVKKVGGKIILSLNSILLLKRSYCIFHIWFIAHWDIHWLSQIASMPWQKSRQYMDNLNLCIGRCCPHESWNCGSIPLFSFISQGKVEWAILSSPYVRPHPQTLLCVILVDWEGV